LSKENEKSPGKSRRSLKTAKAVLSSPILASILTALGVFVAILTLIVAFLALPQASPARKQFAQLLSGSPAATSASTSTALTATPTIPLPTPTVLTFAPAGTIPENIALKCDCSDPVLVTIASINIEPQQGRMIWSLTFFNNSQAETQPSFDECTLQRGNQVLNPAPGEPQYHPTGGGITFYGTAVTLFAGQSKQITDTFSFVPYTNTPYTLVAVLDRGDGIQIKFDPTIITF
jgi:hypothetical protein